MKLGLFGLPQSGKTTLFNALTGSDIPIPSYSHKVEPNIAAVKVLDPRIDALTKMYSPKKTTYTTIEILDVAGLTEEALRQDSFPAELMRLIRNVDALAIVIRDFQTDIISAASNPSVDLRKIEEELLLSDLIVLEKRLEKLQTGHQKGKKTDQSLAEEKLLSDVIEHLNTGKPLRNFEWSPPDLQIIRGFQLLTMKPAFAVVNTDEDHFGKNSQLLAELSATFPTVEFAGNFEMELSRLSAEEAGMFMVDMGITESARARLSKVAYDILGYISFFTVGEDEVRAWNIKSGDTAVTAAGTIHSDLARGFITAECFSYSDLMEYGSEKAVKEAGKFHLVGKEYPVNDGDILSIRFNV